MNISVIGAGAFGTALAQVFSENEPVMLWARRSTIVDGIQASRINETRLPGVRLSDRITATSDLQEALSAEVILLCLPAQELRRFLQQHARTLAGKTLVSCAKGIDLQNLAGTGTLVAEQVPQAVPAILSGPGFAGEIARGLPTALTLACADAKKGAALQSRLATTRLRLYLTDDIRGVEIGGALKNVVAIACGLAIGGGQGESARAAVMTRGFAELRRIALNFGAQEETLFGLSGFGDLALTCTSMQSRNYRLGISLAAGNDPNNEETVEGVSTAKAVSKLAKTLEIELPVTQTIVRVLSGELSVEEAIGALMSRPLRKE